LNLISGVQWWHTNQYSLPFQTSSFYWKLWSCSRQTVQYISWSQGYSISLYISKSILQTFISSVNCTWYNTFVSTVTTNGITSYIFFYLQNLYTTMNQVLLLAYYPSLQIKITIQTSECIWNEISLYSTPISLL